MNFRQSLEDPGYTQVLDEEDLIFDTQDFNSRILASVRFWGTNQKRLREAL